MPLVRFGVKNEFKLGVKELYEDGVKSEDPKAVLDGVAVAGLVGVLRQLGDLAQFAAEVFHGLQEQVASTSSRSRKLANRVQRIETSLPSLEKAILSQTDHLRFAYTPGSEVHACIRIERNHFICDDLPHFVMDSYEECREPPRLQLLDRFDSTGPGSCLKRYSDPTFFKRASSCSEVSNSEKSQRERKTRKVKKRRSSQQSGQLPKSAPTLNDSSRMQFSSTGHEQSSRSHTGSNFDMTFKSDLGDQSDSRGSKNGMDFIEFVSRPSVSSKPLDGTKDKRLSSSVLETDVNTNESLYYGGQTAINSHDVEESLPRSSSATWDERLEFYGTEDIRQLPLTNSSDQGLEFKMVNDKGVSHINDLSEHGSSPKSNVDEWHMETSEGNLTEATGLYNGGIEVQDSQATKYELEDHYLELYHHSELQENCLESPHLDSETQLGDLSERGKPPEPDTNGFWMNDPAYKRIETDDSQFFLVAKSEVPKKEFETTDSYDISSVDTFGNVKTIEWDHQESGTTNAEHASQVYGFSEGGNNVKDIEWNERDLEAINPEYISQEDAFSEGGDNVKFIEWNQPQLETVKAEVDGEMDVTSEGENSVKLIKWSQQERGALNDEYVSQDDTFVEGENTVQVIEWNDYDDIDSGTENFVDALNTIESESESDFETEINSEVLTLTFKDELGENTLDDQVEEGENTLDDQVEERSSHLKAEFEHLSSTYECKEGDLENIHRPTTFVSSANMSSTDHTWSSCLEGATASAPSANIMSTRQSNSAANQQLDVDMHLANEQPVKICQSAILSDVPQDLDISADDTLTRFSKLEKTDEQPQETSQSTILSDVPQGLDIGDDDSLTKAEPGVFRMEKADEQPQETSQSAILFDVPQGLDIGADNSLTRAEPDVSRMEKVDEQPQEISQLDTLSEFPQGLDIVVDDPLTRAEPDVARMEKSDEYPLETCQSATLSNVPQGLDMGADDPLTGTEPDVSEMEKSEVQPLETSQSATLSNVPQSLDIGADDAQTSAEPDVSAKEISGGSEAPDNERITHALDVSQETSVGSSTTYPMAFWTNGSLLGLAPSKPVVFSPPNLVDSAPTNNGNKIGQSGAGVLQKGDGPARDIASSINRSEHGSSKSDKCGQYVGSSNHLSQQILGKLDDTSVCPDKSDSSSHTAIRDLINGDPMLLESKVPVGKSLNSASSDATAASEDRSSLLSVLSRGLLKNGLRRSVSIDYNERNESSSPSKNYDFNTRYQDISRPVLETNLIRKLDSPIHSPPASPPLEHMKISFQPVDGFDASRLKLKYPEGVDQYESTLDAFPSFQLVPESTKLQNDMVSESDDDTFCRSYACTSDVSQSHQSDSDSEQWESGDSTESNDPTLYNGLQRISSTESASTSPLHDETDHENMYDGSRSVTNIRSLSDPSFHLPVLDTKRPISYQEMKVSINPGVNSSHLQKSTHEPPPLPPLQWRLSSALFGEVEDSRDKKSDSRTQSFVPKLSDSLIAHPPKVDSTKLISTAQESAAIAQTKESATVAKSNKVEEQQFGLKQTYHAEKERKIDGGGDFLQQIRNKSFNLRRTEPVRPIYAPTNATNTKITAILQKASAIRKAVGSDDGEDDSWSDA